MATCTVVSSGVNAPSLVKLRAPFQKNKQNESYLSQIILVIDRSGSMSGGKIDYLMYLTNVTEKFK